MIKSDNKRKRILDLYSIMSELPQDMLEVKCKLDDENSINDEQIINEAEASYLKIDRGNIVKMDEENKIKNEQQDSVVVFNNSNNLKRGFILKIAAAAIAVAACLCIVIGVKSNQKQNAGNESGNADEKVNEKEVKTSDDETMELGDRDDFNKVLEYYIKYLNKWDEYAIQEVTDCIYFDSNQDYWDQMSGSVTYEIMEENEYMGSKETLVKLVFDIEEPGGSSLIKGKNERYVYFFNIPNQGGCWTASIISTKDDIENYCLKSRKEKFDAFSGNNGTTYILSQGYAFNGGLGYGKLEIDKNFDGLHVIPCDHDVYVDMNGDGKIETLNVAKSKEYIVSENTANENTINEIKDIHVNGEAKKLNYESGYSCECYYIVDLNPNDNYIEIAFYEKDNDYKTCIYRYDGDNFSLLKELNLRIYTGNNYSRLDYYGRVLKDDDNQSSDYDYDSQCYIDIFFGENWLKNKCYTVTEDGIMENDCWYITNPDITTEADILVYTSKDINSKKVNLPKNSKIKIADVTETEVCIDDNNYDDVIWIEVEKEDGTKVYIQLLDYDTFENGDTEMNRYELYSGWTDKEKMKPYVENSND